MQGRIMPQRGTNVYNRRALTTSKITAAISSELEAIKSSEGMTDRDLGEHLGFSDGVQARKYRIDEAEMSVSTFARGVRAFGPAFGSAVMGLAGFRLEPMFDARIPDQEAPVVITAALLKIVEALANDAAIDPAEVRSMRPELLRLQSLVASLLDRSGPRAVAS